LKGGTTKKMGEKEKVPWQRGEKGEKVWDPNRYHTISNIKKRGEKSKRKRKSGRSDPGGPPKKGIPGMFGRGNGERPYALTQAGKKWEEDWGKKGGGTKRVICNSSFETRKSRLAQWGTMEKKKEGEETLMGENKNPQVQQRRESVVWKRLHRWHLFGGMLQRGKGSFT